MKILFTLLYLGVLLLIFFVLPVEVLYSQGIISWTPFILIFILQTYLLSLLLKAFSVNPKYFIGACALSVLIIGPAFGYYLRYQEKKDFNEKGKTVKGIVYRKWRTYGKNSELLLRCHYVVDGVTYSTFSKTDKSNRYKIGDTLTVIFLESYPQKSIIRELD